MTGSTLAGAEVCHDKERAPCLARSLFPEVMRDFAAKVDHRITVLCLRGAADEDGSQFEDVH